MCVLLCSSALTKCDTTPNFMRRRDCHFYAHLYRNASARYHIVAVVSGKCIQFNVYHIYQRRGMLQYQLLPPPPPPPPKVTMCTVFTRGEVCCSISCSPPRKLQCVPYLPEGRGVLQYQLLPPPPPPKTKVSHHYKYSSDPNSMWSG